jgi:hypothetical protein
LNHRQDEQRDRCRTGQSVHDTDDQGAQRSVQAESAEPLIEPRLRRLVFAVAVVRAAVAVRVAMNVVAMTVRVGMQRAAVPARREQPVTNPLHESGQVHDSENDEHQGHAELHREAQPRRYGDLEHDDGAADEENGDRVPNAPRASHQRRAPQRAVPGDDGGDRDDVIGIGGMPHTEKEPEDDERQETHETRIHAGDLTTARIALPARACAC